jgi:hypothetical protein
VSSLQGATLLQEMSELEKKQKILRHQAIAAVKHTLPPLSPSPTPASVSYEFVEAI